MTREEEAGWAGGGWRCFCDVLGPLSCLMRNTILSVYSVSAYSISLACSVYCITHIPCNDIIPHPLCLSLERKEGREAEEKD